MSTVPEAMSVVMVMATENDVDDAIRLISQFVVVWFTHVTQADNNLRTLLSQLWHELFGDSAGGLVDKIWWKTINSCKPLPLTQANQTHFDAVRGSEHVSPFGVAQGNILSQRGIQNIGQ